jgi:hypothetical protein
MRRSVFLAATSLVCVPGVIAQQHNIDTQKSTLTIQVGKTGAFSNGNNIVITYSKPARWSIPP